MQQRMRQLTGHVSLTAVESAWVAWLLQHRDIKVFIGSRFR